eukprot:229905_1
MTNTLQCSLTTVIMFLSAMTMISFVMFTFQHQDKIVYATMEMQHISHDNITDEQAYLNDITAKIKHIMRQKHLDYNSVNAMKAFVNQYIAKNAIDTYISESKSTLKPTEKPIPKPITQLQPESKPETQIDTNSMYQYIDINAYSNYNRTDKIIDIIPSSWEELNEQQFCTLEDTTDENISLLKFLQYIYEIQFNQDCNDPNHKFVIYQIEMEAKNGLGASLLGNIKRYFAASLMLNRTFLLTGAHDWAHSKSYCNHTDAMECYFLPPSNCNPKHILSNIDQNNPQLYYEGHAPDNCIFGNNINENINLTHCKYRIMHLTSGVRRYVMLNGDINNWIRKQFDLPMMAYEAMIATFFLRPQPIVRKIVYNKISKSINKCFNGKSIPNINTNTLIAYPIRASDKCDSIGTVTGKHYTHPSEIECFTPIEHLRVMNSIQYLTNDTINTVIFTSEDESFLNKVITLMKDVEISNVSKWNIIRNTEDYSVGEGTTTFTDTVKHYKQAIKEGVGTSLETDHIVSAISSLMFQVHLEPKYIVYGDSSTWLKLMWKWLSFLNCNIKPELHLIDNNKCIELSTPGYLHMYGKFKYKFVKYSEEIWKRIHSEGLEPTIFEKRFGINITRFGWDNWCENGFKNKLKFRL